MKYLLTDIPGIGESTAALLGEHGIDSVKALRKAGVKKLRRVPGFAKTRAVTVLAAVDDLKAAGKQIKRVGKDIRKAARQAEKAAKAAAELEAKEAKKAARKAAKDAQEAARKAGKDAKKASKPEKRKKVKK